MNGGKASGDGVCVCVCVCVCPQAAMAARRLEALEAREDLKQVCFWVVFDLIGLVW